LDRSHGAAVHHDVWDETSALVVFGDAHQSAMQLVSMILKTPLPFWRPIPDDLRRVTIHALPPNVAWPVLRIVKCLDDPRRCRADDPRGDELGGTRRSPRFRFSSSPRSSPPAPSSWPAGSRTSSMPPCSSSPRGDCSWSRAAGFWKQASFSASRFSSRKPRAMVLPLLLILVAIDRIQTSRRDQDRHYRRSPSASSTSVCAASSFRSGPRPTRIQFQLSMLLPTAKGLIESYWRETLWGSPGVIGYIVFAFSIAAMRTWRARAAFVAYSGAAVVLYLSMFAGIRTGPHPLSNVRPAALLHPGHAHALRVRGRSSLVGRGDSRDPAAHRRDRTYTRYERFQRSYRNLYRYAATAAKPVTIDYAMKPLHDPRRGIEIGDFPDAPMKLDPVKRAAGQRSSRPRILPKHRQECLCHTGSSRYQQSAKYGQDPWWHRHFLSVLVRLGVLRKSNRLGFFPGLKKTFRRRGLNGGA